MKCSLGSCDDHIFSRACTEKCIHVQCPRYETPDARDNDTIMRNRHNEKHFEKLLMKEKKEAKP